MGNYKFILFFVAFVFLGCHQEPLLPHQSIEVHKLVGNWRYTSIIVSDSIQRNFPFNRQMEFIENNFKEIQNSGFRFNIVSRRIRFVENSTYVINWVDFGDYELGVPGTSYQPDFGSWEINQGQSVMIQNGASPYETMYEILELTDSTLVRKYDRKMSSTFPGANWSAGDWVTYEEHFRAVE